MNGEQLRLLAKKRFGYEPGDEKFAETIQLLAKDPGYGMKPVVQEKVTIKTAPKQNGGLGGKIIASELERRRMFSGNGTGTPDIKGIFSKAFGF